MRSIQSNAYRLPLLENCNPSECDCKIAVVTETTNRIVSARLKGGELQALDEEIRVAESKEPDNTGRPFLQIEDNPSGSGLQDVVFYSNDFDNGNGYTVFLTL